MLARVSATRSHAESLQSLEVVLTTACNLSCPYCFQNARGGSRMDWETLRAALDLLLRSDEQVVSLTFYGGEPLLEFPQIKRAIRYIESAKSPDKKFEYHLITNGLLLGRDTTSFLAHHGVETQISFDGAITAQDLRAPGTFNRLDRLLQELRETEEHFFNSRCTLAITLSSQNVTYLAESFAYFLDRGARNVAISPLVTHDPGWQPDLIDVLIEQVAAVSQMSRTHYRQTGETPFVPFQTSNPTAPPDTGPPAMCKAADTDELALDVDGRLFRCVMLVDSYQTFPEGTLRRNLERLRLGNLGDPDLDRRFDEYPAAVSAAEIFANKQEKYSSYRECGSCRFLHQCSICPISICHIPGNTDPNRVPDLPCAVNLVMLAARDLFLVGGTDHSVT
jgi:sulfatase maturation enzyme AslB (radical SAM superfamily)